MKTALRRRKNRPRPVVEALEARALLAFIGSLDSSVGGGYGYVTAPLNIPVTSVSIAGTLPEQTSFSVQAESVDVLPDGGTVVSGPITYDNGYGGQGVGTQSSALAVVELNADGTPNTSFGTDGMVALPIANDQQFQMAVQPNGQILLASTTIDASNESTYLAVRLNTNGALDTTFGTNGVAEYPAGATTPAIYRINQLSSILLQSNGQILLAGSAYSGAGGFAVVRLNTDGSLDTTYGTDGTSNYPAPDSDAGNSIEGTGAVIQSDGDVVLVGDLATYNLNQAELGESTLVASVPIAIRLTTDGALDPTFGGSGGTGVVELPFNPYYTSLSGLNFADAVAIDSNTGDILVAGSQEQTGSGALLPTVYALTTSGSLDPNFGLEGLVHPALYVNSYGNVAMTTEADGDIVLTSSVATGSTGGPTANKLEVDVLSPQGGESQFEPPNSAGGSMNIFGPAVTTLPAFTPASTSGLAPTSLTPAIDPTTGDILVAGAGTIGSSTGLTYGFTVDSLLSTTNDAPDALTPLLPPADFSGEGYSDLSYYDPTTASFVNSSVINSGSTQTVNIGATGVGATIPAVADYGGLGYDQDGVYLTATGTYAIPATINSVAQSIQFGIPGAGQTIPVPADYYGTGQADIAVYLPSQAVFAIQGLYTNGYGRVSTGEEIPFGIPGAGQSIPVPADYYGSGQADIAVYLAASGVWAIQPVPGVPNGELIPFGKPGLGESDPVPGDYDGSGKVELAVYVPSVGAFFYRSDLGKGDVEIPIGTPNSGDIPVPGDYDGSGHLEAAIYSPTGGYIEYAPADGGPDVYININAPAGSIPVATPPGDLPEFVAPSGSTDAIKANAIVPSSGSMSSTNAIKVTPASAVPSGPALASIRVALAPVNQGVTDPLKFAS
jgi:uncharacterized delta-60 repeat protein